jgi:hypothetical protein
MTMTWEERLRASEAVVAEHKKVVLIALLDRFISKVEIRW